MVGLNQDRLIARLAKQGINLYDLKKVSNKKMYMSVNLNQSQKFFAITKEMCYNVKKARETGKHLWVYKLLTNFGLVLGALAFLVISFFSGDLLFGLEFSGNGEIYKNQVAEYLSRNGVQKYARFSDLKLDRLEDLVLANNDRLSFVSLEKKGNFLSVYLVLKTDKGEVLTGNATKLVATESGIVESVKVYRGTAKVGVGDIVSAGEILVEGFAVVKDQTIPVNVIAFVTVISQREFVFESPYSQDGDKAVAFAEENLSEREILGSTVTVEEDGDKYKYTVKTDYRSVFFVG